MRREAEHRELKWIESFCERQQVTSQPDGRRQQADRASKRNQRDPLNRLEQRLHGPEVQFGAGGQRD